MAHAVFSDEAFNETFEVVRRQSIPSAGRAVRVPIAKWTLDAVTTLISRPQMREGAYRLVSITNQGETPLMRGNVNIFAESDFIGTAMLEDHVVQRQAFDLPFGFDNSITVKREILSQNRIVKSNRISIDRTIRIALSNNGSATRTVLLEEALPISQDSRVEVKLGRIEPELTSRDSKGIGGWAVQLRAGEEVSVTIPFRIVHPAGFDVEGL
jgi:uncharacterized protein (TIGR02231 family)